MNRIINLANDPFQLRWLLRLGFWRVVFGGIMAKLGYITTYGESSTHARMTIGTKKPLYEWWVQGWKAEPYGHVFNEPIIYYHKNEN